MKSPDPSEEQIQASIIAWLRVSVPCAIAAIPNAGKRGFAAQRQVKREGLSKGAPDLVVAYSDNGEPRTLWIECKSRTGRLSPEQRAWREWLTDFGHDHIVARSIDDVRHFFEGDEARA